MTRINSTSHISQSHTWGHISISSVHGVKISSGPEIERIFFVRYLPDNIEQYEKEDIKQGYVTENGDQDDYRLRHIGDTYVLTIKKSTDDPMVREETELEIPQGDFENLWKDTKGQRLKKTRYYIPTNQECKHGYVELDIFKKKLKGHMVVEIEFDSVEQARKFTPPDWFGKEVTNDKRYRSKNLAIKGLPG